MTGTGAAEVASRLESSFTPELPLTPPPSALRLDRSTLSSKHVDCTRRRYTWVAAWDAVMGGVGSANPSNSNPLGLDTSHEASLRRPKPTREPGRQLQVSRPADGHVPHRAGRRQGRTTQS